MTGEQFVDRLKKQFGDDIAGANFTAIDPWIEVAPHALIGVCRYLRDEGDLKFDMLNCISGVDYLQTDPKKAKKTDWDPHIEVVYHLSSIEHKHNIIIKVILPRWKNDVPDELPEVPSVSSIWSTADWHEREVYDLSGIWFEGHPDLRRILCPEDWVGHALRKDYEFPLEYHGIRGR